MGEMENGGEMKILDSEVLCAFYMISIRTEQKSLATNLLKSCSQPNFLNFFNLLNSVKKLQFSLNVEKEQENIKETYRDWIFC